MLHLFIANTQVRDSVEEEERPEEKRKLKTSVRKVYLVAFLVVYKKSLVLSQL